jgi:hypothetical protein
VPVHEPRSPIFSILTPPGTGVVGVVVCPGVGVVVVPGVGDVTGGLVQAVTSEVTNNTTSRETVTTSVSILFLFISLPFF